MRHGKRKHKLGVSGPHRSAMMGNLAVALITHGRIETTLAKAKALRPFIEKIITLAKKAEKANDAARKLHFRRLAIVRVRDKKAVAQLFDERVSEFVDRPGGYTRIYKLGQRIGDAAEMALIELIDGNDEGYEKPKKKAAKKASKKAAKKAAKKGTKKAAKKAAKKAVAKEESEAAAEEGEPLEEKAEEVKADEKAAEASSDEAKKGA
jgi:large subunit ribosomal protein L17